MRNPRRPVKPTFAERTLIVLAALVFIAVIIAVPCAIIYTIAHFVMKFW